MIAWNAFFTYILKPTTNIKIIVVSILAASLWIRQTKSLKKFYSRVQSLNGRKALLGILLLAFIVRLGWVIWSPHIPPAAITEEKQIWQHAINLADGVGFIAPTGEPTAYRPIGYPFFLSILIRIFGPHLEMAISFQVLFGVLNVLCIFLLVRNIHSDLLGVLAAFIYACYPTAIMATKIVMEEHLFILLWLVGILLLVSDYQKPSYVRVAIAGIVVGISATIRTYSIITAVAVFIVWFLAKRDLKEALKRSLLLFALFFLCALPWAIRNYYRLGVPLPYTSIVGLHLYYSNNPTADVRYPVNPGIAEGGDPEFLSAETEVERDFAGRRAALRWIKNNPSPFLQKAFGRICYMLGLNNEGWVIEDNFVTIRADRERPSPKLRKKLEKFELYYYVTIFWFACVGLLIFFTDWLRHPSDKGMIYIVTILALYILVTAIALNHRKYRFVIEPFFTIFSVYGLFKTFFGAIEKRGVGNPIHG